MTLLFDLTPVPHACCDHTLEELYKALADPPGKGIWRPHHDPFIRDQIEGVTDWGVRLLESIQMALFAMFPSKGELAKAEWGRWSREELERVHDYLKDKKDTVGYSIDDWMQLVDWLFQRYLPADIVLTEAEYLAVRATMQGKIQANLDNPDKAVIEVLAASAPSTLAQAREVLTLTPRQEFVIEFARARAAELIVDIGDRTRHRLKQAILSHEQLAAQGDKSATLGKLQSNLLDEFGILNRDWRRIALTETARNANEGFIASLDPGTKVRRIESYPDACPFCKHIHGKVFTVVSPSKKDKDGDAEVWVGKDNVGRSSSPRKRVGDELVERTSAEMWWVAAGVQHPSCRGSWTLARDETPPGVDPKFDQWMKDELKKAGFPMPGIV